MGNEQLDKELRKEELKQKFVKPAIVAAVIAFGLLMLFIATPKKIEHQSDLLSGNTLRQIPVSEGYGYDFAMIVELADGKEARVAVKKAVAFRENAKVEINRISTDGGNVSYEFNRYLD